MSESGEHDRDTTPQAAGVPPFADGEDIYAEDGSVRSDFLMHVGAAIADRDLLFLRQHVARLPAGEAQQRAAVRLVGDRGGAGERLLQVVGCIPGARSQRQELVRS